MTTINHALAILSVTLLSACASIDSANLSRSESAIDPNDAGPLTEIISDGAVAPNVQGVWVSRGYGFILDVTADGLTRYHDDGFVCFPTPETAKGATDTLAFEYRYFRMTPSGQWAIFQLLPDDTQIVFDRAAALPERCRISAKTDHATIFDVYARLFSNHYAFFEERKIDWPTRVTKASEKLGAASTSGELFDLLASMIDGFSDSHTKLLAVIDGEKRRRQDGQGVTLPMIRSGMGETPWLIGIIGNLLDNTLSSGSHVANDRIIWGMIDDRIGYIQVFVMGGFTGVDIGDPSFRDTELAALDAIMQEAINSFEGADAVIVDLSNNRGGYDAISRRIAGYFAEAPFVAYTAQARGTGLPPADRIAEAPGDVRFTGPVYLLTSDVTVSGGELAALALKQLPNVMHVGGVTRGSFSTVFSKPLPNGWIVEMSNEVIAGADGRVYEETGITPEILIDVFPEDDPVGGHASAIDAIVNIIDDRRTKR